MNTRSIRFRLIAWYAGLLIAVFVLLGGLIYAGLKIYLENSLAAVQTRRAAQIGETLLANVPSTGEAHVISEINSWFAPATIDRFIRVMKGGGALLYLSDRPRDGSFDPQTVPQFRGGSITRTWRVETMATGVRLLIASVPYQAPGGSVFLIEVGESLEPVRAVLRRLILLLASGLAAMVLVAVAGGYLLVRRALAPVDEIAASAERITLRHLSERLPIANTGDELERLAVSLNHMIARLEDALQQNRRFTEDASHELRTPLTIMRGELESIVVEPRLSPEARETVGSVLEEVERLARIVEGLFAISRLDAGEARKEHSQFDLATLAASTAEQMCLLAEDKGITITTDAPCEVPVEGDRARMKQVVVNLLDNAIKYTAPGGAVGLSVSTHGDRAVLEVRDNGMGIPESARPHIFERFFRVDKARSREMGGAGLGLSIVKSICVAHGGKVDFNSTEGRGSRFTVELPIAPPLNGKIESKNGS